LAAGGDEAIAEAFGDWRQRHDQSLLIVDQFEELFTQNTDEEQRRCAEILGRIALDADVHVVLSMRDDFFVRCNQYEQLRPMYSEVTVLDPPHGSALRRAVVQPALRCGYRFEDEELADEILAEVEGERGALPLLAFALARLWEKRDRENGLITRQAYRDIGGVGGSLAGHAEALMERLGPERHGIVREIFRNLVTAQGTRAARDTDELLSVFRDNRDEAAEVLRALIDARLLTSYEVPSDDGPGRQRMEIIHESLLRAWPRLVRWQTQDADAAQLRDELRHAAKQWDEHERSDDYLWSGRAYREFALWHESYPGGLTDLEAAFAAAMTSLATRRRRRQRIAVTAGFAILLAGLAIVGSFWRRSVLETRRAEAANLLSLGQLHLESYPSATLAHAIASLDLADSYAARTLALETLWKAPTALFVNDRDTWWVRFSADGNRIVQSTRGRGAPINVIDQHGRLTAIDRPSEWGLALIYVSPTGDYLLANGWNETGQAPQHAILWSLPDGRKVAEARYAAPSVILETGWNERRVVLLILEGDGASLDAVSFDGTIERLATFDLDLEPLQWAQRTKIDVQNGRWLAVVDDATIMVHEILEDGLSAPRVLERHEGRDIRISIDPQGRYAATKISTGEARIWDLTGGSPPRVVQLQADSSEGGFRSSGAILLGNGDFLTCYTYEDGQEIYWFWSLTAEGARFLRRIDTGLKGLGFENWDPGGMRLARSGPDEAVRIWSLAAPADAEPLELLRGDVGRPWDPRFHPSGRLIATADERGLAVWPLTREYPFVIRGHDAAVNSVVFDPRGQWLASGGTDDTIRLWPLSGTSPEQGRVLFGEDSFDISRMAVSPDSELLLAGSTLGPAVVVPVNGSPSTKFEGFLTSMAVAFSANGELAAIVATKPEDFEEQSLYVYEVGSWGESVFDEPDYLNVNPHFLRDGRILAVGEAGLWRVDLESHQCDLVYPVNSPESIGQFAVSRDERRIALLVELEGAPGTAVVLDLEAGTTTALESHGHELSSIALDPTGTVVVTGDASGVVRVGSATGEEPYLLLGHEGRVWSVAIDPLGRRIASGGQDGTVRLWPMPDLSKPPLHTLPRSELIAKLKTLTNLRVVRDEESTTGWKLTHDPFPGWETVPTW
jgi:WD40 repeat protein